jgi:hypothetical protein
MGDDKNIGVVQLLWRSPMLGEITNCDWTPYG